MEIYYISASYIIVSATIHIFILFIPLFQRFVKIFMKRNHSLCKSAFLGRDYKISMARLRWGGAHVRMASNSGFDGDVEFAKSSSLASR